MEKGDAMEEKLGKSWTLTSFHMICCNKTPKYILSSSSLWVPKERMGAAITQGDILVFHSARPNTDP